MRDNTVLSVTQFSKGCIQPHHAVVACSANRCTTTGRGLGLLYRRREESDVMGVRR